MNTFKTGRTYNGVQVLQIKQVDREEFLILDESRNMSFSVEIWGGWTSESDLHSQILAAYDAGDYEEISLDDFNAVAIEEAAQEATQADPLVNLSNNERDGFFWGYDFSMRSLESITSVMNNRNCWLVDYERVAAYLVHVLNIDVVIQETTVNDSKHHAIMYRHQVEQA